ncbi:hypothetical protein ACJRO7_019249 [Eucalyptus globulus]|uniref:Glycosyl transferase CAP10 domain-containing protein n=1 Tax=Eucalyptus globulus TaxID=34317 RepID=A0ABD3KCT5_EUCGL
MEEESSSRGCYGGKAWRPVKTWASATVFVLFTVVLLSGVFISWIDIPTFTFPGASIFKTTANESSAQPSLKKTESPKTEFPPESPKTEFPPEPAKKEFPINCPNATTKQTCPLDYPLKHETKNIDAEVCPEYFRWIHEDLRPWKAAGITREMLEGIKSTAHFRIVVHKGKVYLDKFRPAYQTREEFTFWGIAQLARLYPGKLPDLELMFQCEDRPAIKKEDYKGSKGTKIPPLFHYCGHHTAFDIPFPDWSFWGWPEVNIKPWESTLSAIKEKAQMISWNDREPYAYWKGNPTTSRGRGELLKCNDSKEIDWKARVYNQDWGREMAEGFKHSNLEDQCTHRYNIYIEGIAWSVSQKYVLACDAMTLRVKPDYYDIYSRGMIPMDHYWPIRPHKMCRDIKYAVEWGDEHPAQAQAIGENGRRYVAESAKMKYVYDYMFHLLSEYAKLLKFETTVPPGAVEMCSEAMACPFSGSIRKFMDDSMVMSPSDVPPCSLPPPYKPDELKALLERKEKVTRGVEMEEARYWRDFKRGTSSWWSRIFHH